VSISPCKNLNGEKFKIGPKILEDYGTKLYIKLKRSAREVSQGGLSKEIRGRRLKNAPQKEGAGRNPEFLNEERAWDLRKGATCDVGKSFLNWGNNMAEQVWESAFLRERGAPI